jgi:hypothetical protein
MRHRSPDPGRVPAPTDFGPTGFGQEAELFEDEFDQERPVTADGLLHWLHMLAAEADELKLARTRAAIEQALRICHDEGADDGPTHTPARRTTTIH